MLFAQFVRPDEITVFTDCVRRAGALREESGCPLLEPERLMDVLLAHELFHGVEEQNADRIYTRTEKVELWRKAIFQPLHHCLPVGDGGHGFRERASGGFRPRPTCWTSCSSMHTAGNGHGPFTMRYASWRDLRKMDPGRAK